MAEDSSGLVALRQRLLVDERFRYRRHELFTTIFAAPLTVEMVMGEQLEAVRKVVTGIDELNGGQLEFFLEGDTDQVSLCVRRWREEAQLRSLDQSTDNDGADTLAQRA